MRKRHRIISVTRKRSKLYPPSKEVLIKINQRYFIRRMYYEDKEGRLIFQDTNVISGKFKGSVHTRYKNDVDKYFDLLIKYEGFVEGE